MHGKNMQVTYLVQIVHVQILAHLLIHLVDVNVLRGHLSYLLA